MSRESTERDNELRQLSSDSGFGPPPLPVTPQGPPIEASSATSTSALSDAPSQSEPLLPSAHGSNDQDALGGLEGTPAPQVSVTFSTDTPFTFRSLPPLTTLSSSYLPSGETPGPIDGMLAPIEAQLREAAQRAAALIAESRASLRQGTAGGSASRRVLQGIGAVVFSGRGASPVFVDGSSPGAAGNLLRRLIELRRTSTLSPASLAQIDALLNAHAYTQEAAAEEPDPCPICLDELALGEHGLHMPCCGNSFHRVCILRWLGQESSRCPVCRTVLPDNQGGAETGEEGALGLQSIAELKQRCSERGLDCSQCIEKSEVVKLLESQERARPAAGSVPLDAGSPTLHAAAAMAARAFAEAMSNHIPASSAAAGHSVPAPEAAVAATRRRSPSSSEGRPGKRRRTA